MCAYMCMCECDNLIIHMPVEPAPSGRLVDCVGRLEAPARHAPAHTRAHICANEHRTRTPRKRTRERTFFGLDSGASTPNTCPPRQIPTKEPPPSQHTVAHPPTHIRIRKRARSYARDQRCSGARGAPALAAAVAEGVVGRAQGHAEVLGVEVQQKPPDKGVCVWGSHL